MRNPKILVLDRNSDLGEQVRSVGYELRPRPDIVLCDRATDLDEMMSREGPFDVMIAGPSIGTRTGLARLASMHDDRPAMSLLLAFAKRPEVQLREIVRTGAMDLLQLPVTDQLLQDAIERAVSVSRPRGSVESMATPAHAKPELGTVFTVGSATGGCGKTFYATNLAYFLHQHTGKRVCIVDLDLQFGEVSTALRLRPKFSISDVLSRDDADEADLAMHFDEYVVAHDTGFHVLAAPKDPSEADRIHPLDVTRVIEAARTRFDYVVVDTPAALTEIVLAAFDLSDQLYVLATLDLPSVRNMGVFLNTLDKLKIPSDNVKLILNKAESDVGIDVEQVTKLFPQGFTSVLPYAREVSKSVNIGTPILGFSPGSEVSRRLAGGMAALLPEASRNRLALAEASPRRRHAGPFGWMFRSMTHPSGAIS